MTLREHLDLFYRQYNIPENGGVDDKTFEVPLPYLTLKLPNYPWRKRMLYIHDLEHVLNRQDTTWKGEMFIASWEIATGFYQNFPVIVFPLWTMGWGIWRYPKTVFTAFRKGFFDKGIVRLGFKKEELLKMDLAQLELLTLNKRLHRSRLSFWSRLFSWGLLSQFVFLLPLVVLAIFLSMLFY